MYTAGCLIALNTVEYLTTFLAIFFKKLNVSSITFSSTREKPLVVYQYPMEA